jgi:hypothetical protein
MASTLAPLAEYLVAVRRVRYALPRAACRCWLAEDLEAGEREAKPETGRSDSSRRVPHV